MYIEKAILSYRSWVGEQGNLSRGGAEFLWGGKFSLSGTPSDFIWWFGCRHTSARLRQGEKETLQQKEG